MTEEKELYLVAVKLFLRENDKLLTTHDIMEWVEVNTFQPEAYFTGGWLSGVQEYLKLVRDEK